MKKIIYGLFSISMSCVFFSSHTIAKEHPHHQPPQEAIQACQDLTENAEVSFNTPRGDTLEASCKIIDGILVAVPINPPPQHKHSSSTLNNQQ